MEWEAVVTVQSSMEPAGRAELSPGQLQQLVGVIAGMDSVRAATGDQDTQHSPPPTDQEIQQFIDYVGMGVINRERLEYEERRKQEEEAAGQPEPPKRSKQANQYFWRRHYLSIIQVQPGQPAPPTALPRRRTRRNCPSSALPPSPGPAPLTRTT